MPPPAQPGRLIFRRSQRLTHAKQFEAVHSARVQKARGPLAVSGLPNGLDRSRLGLSVGRRIGGAVVRNQAKRVVREAFRLCAKDLPGGLDLVVAVRPRRGGVPRENLDLEECRELLVDLAWAVAREWDRREPEKAAKGSES